MRSCRTLKSKHRNKSDVYMVKSIIAERFVKNEKFYKVRWEGFSADDDSWEPENNLGNVRNLIINFHEVKNNSIPHRPKLIPNKRDSSLHQLTSAKKKLASYRLKTRKQFLNSKKCMTKSRGGNFEYVPQNQLIASKTKYFDDIRDGKIDLNLNDLYSRVKTRKRCLVDPLENPDIQDLLLDQHDFNELDTAVTKSEILSRYSAPSSPKNVSQSTDGSIDDCISAVSDPTHGKSSFLKMDTSQVSVKSLLINNTSRTNEKESHEMVDLNFKVQKRINQNFKNRSQHRRYFSKRSNLISLIKNNMNKSSCIRKSAHSMNIIQETKKSLQPASRNISTPCSTLQWDYKSLSSNQQKILELPDEINPIEFRQTVPSSKNLMQHYIDLFKKIKASKISDFESELKSSLAQFPLVEPVDYSISSEEEMIFAISQHHWNLLCSQPLEQIISRIYTSKNKKEYKKETNFDNINLNIKFLPKFCHHHPLVAAIIEGEGNPFILSRLLQCGFFPDFIDPNSGWPILTIATYFKRFHAVRILLDAYAQPNIYVNINGCLKTPLSISISTGDVDMASLLILNGANFYQVEKDTTAMKLIIQILDALTTIHCESYIKPQFVRNLHNDYEPYKAFKQSFDKLSYNSTIMPVIRRSDDVSLYRSPYDYLTPSKSMSSLINEQVNCSTDRLPSPACLSQIYELVACHHSRLSMATYQLVQRWLLSVGLVQTNLIMPCQWINIRQELFSLSFSLKNIDDKCITEFTNTSLKTYLPTQTCVPLLLLIHGTVTPPGCYHVWMEDGGPCYVEKVLVGVIEQKPLSQHLFVTTLLSLDQTYANQSVSVHLIPKQQRIDRFGKEDACVCIAAIIITAKVDEKFEIPKKK